MKKIFILAVAAVALAACNTYPTYTISNARSMEVPAEMLSSYNTSDLVVSETKVQGMANLVISKKYVMDKETACQNAIADALRKANADVLVCPSFTYEYVNGLFSRVLVSGYPAHFANFRTIPLEQINTNEEKEPAAPQIVIYGAEVHNEVLPVAPAEQPAEQPAVSSNKKNNK